MPPTERDTNNSLLLQSQARLGSWRPQRLVSPVVRSAPVRTHDLSGRRGGAQTQVLRVRPREAQCVRIPVTLLFDVMRALNDNLAAYESAWGEIKRPEQEEQED